MKKIFLTFLIIYTTSLFAKSNVLLIFPKLENLSLTGNLVTSGIEFSLKQFPDYKNEIKFISIEAEVNLKELATSVEKAITTHQPIAIIGAITSNTAFVLAEIAEKNKIPFITPFATHPDVTKDKNFTFRVCFDDAYQASQLASFIVKKLNKKKIAILFNSTNSYSLGIKSRFSEEIQALGSKIVSEIGVLNSSELSSEKIKKLVSSKPEVILIPSYQIEAASLIAQIAPHLPKSTVFIGPDSWGGGRLFHKVFNDGDINFEGYYVQHLAGVNFKSYPEFDQFVNTTTLFKDNSQNKTAAMIAPLAIGYDTGRVLLEGIKYSKSLEIPLVEAIKKVNIAGVTGHIDFTKGQTAQKPLFIYKINKTNETFFEEYR